MIKRLFFVCLTLFGSPVLFLSVTVSCAFAQNSNFYFDHVAQKEGLEEPAAVFLKQDELGYIWIGTANGLVRYDGLKPKVYRFGTHVGSCFVRSMVEDEHKDLWFCNDENGLFKYNRSKDAFELHDYPANIAGMLLDCSDGKGRLWGLSQSRSGKVMITNFDIEHDRFTFFDKLGQVFEFKRDNQLWLGSTKGFYRFDEKTQKFLAETGVTDTSKSISAISESPDQPGIFIVGFSSHDRKTSGIESIDTRRKIIHDYIPSLSPGANNQNDTVNFCYYDKRKRLWLGTQNGLMLFDNKKKIFHVFIPADTDKYPGKNNIRDIAEAKDGRLWLSSGRGILYFDPGSDNFQRITVNTSDPGSISSNTPREHMLVDRSGIFWAANFDAGTNKIDPVRSAFRFYAGAVRDGSNFHNGITNDVATGPDGRIYFSNNSGIYSRQPGNKAVTRVYKASATDAYIDAICVGKDGRIYFCNGKGLQVLDPASQKLQSFVSTLLDTTTLSSNKINVIVPDKTGLFWIGTEDRGLCTFNPITNRFKRYPYQESNLVKNKAGALSDAVVNSIYEDREGVIWVGTNSGGLNKFDRATQIFQAYFYDKHLNSIGPMLEDSKGRFWVTCFQKGLTEFDQKRSRFIRSFGSDNGLLNDGIGGICQDGKGNLWLSSMTGLTKLDPNNFSFKNYPLISIFPDQNILYNYNLYQAGDQLALVMQNGMALFNPDNLAANPYPPMVSIEKVIYSDPSLHPLKQQLQQFKYNSELFYNTLTAQPKYTQPDEEWSIVLGNAEAENIITMVSNPYCPPCAKTHKLLHDLLGQQPGLQARIVFTATNTDEDIKTPISRHMMTLNGLPDKAIVKQALYDCYEQKQKNYEAWAKAYPAELNETEYNKINKQKAWCELAEVTATPTMLLNGYRLPSVYQLTDLKYMLQ
jgi:ligand-binding sensor domain-containing protein/Fe-S cluster biosynthesis and repair protein YggX